MNVIQDYWAQILTLVAGIVHAVRQEGRINVHEEKFKTIDVRFAAQDKISEIQNTDIIERLGRIERKQDSVISSAASHGVS